MIALFFIPFAFLFVCIAAGGRADAEMRKYYENEFENIICPRCKREVRIKKNVCTFCPFCGGKIGSCDD